MRGINGVHKKPPARVRLAPSSKILVSREEAAQLLSNRHARDRLSVGDSQASIPEDRGTGSNSRG